MVNRWLSVELPGAHAALIAVSIACSSAASHTRFARQSTRSFPAVARSHASHVCAAPHTC